MRARLRRASDMDVGRCRSAWVALGHGLFRVRDGLVPVVIVLLLVTPRRADLLFAPSGARALATIGVLLLAAGIALRALVAAAVDIRRSGRHRRIAASRLVRHGLYAHTRNPLYLANVLLILGLAGIRDSCSAWLVVVPIALLGVGSMIGAEEAFLAQRFGPAYDRYCAAVPRFWPRLHGLSATLIESHLDWRRAARREHGTVFATVTTALLMVVAHRIARDGTLPLASVRAMATLWMACVGVYAVVRVLKKTGRLATPARPIRDVTPRVTAAPDGLPLRRSA